MHVVLCDLFWYSLHAEHNAGVSILLQTSYPGIICNLFSSNPQVYFLPTPLPLALLQIVSSPKLDWISPYFSMLFRDIITVSTYTTGINHYMRFCNLATRNALPTIVSTLLVFASYLTSIHLSHSTINVYLSCVQSLHVAHGDHSSFNCQLTPHLQ